MRAPESFVLLAESGGPHHERLRRMLAARVLFRFDSLSQYHASLDELLTVLRAAYLQRRERWFHAEARVLAEALEAGRRAGAFEFPSALAAARTLVVATNSLLPVSLSARELGSREAVEREVGRVTELLLRGLLRRGAREFKVLKLLP